MLASSYTVFRNDCTWAGGGLLLRPGRAGSAGTSSTTDACRATDTPHSSLAGFDASGVHIQSGVALSGATDDQNISSFQFALLHVRLDRLGRHRSRLHGQPARQLRQRHPDPGQAVQPDHPAAGDPLRNGDGLLRLRLRGRQPPAGHVHRGHASLLDHHGRLRRQRRLLHAVGRRRHVGQLRQPGQVHLGLREQQRVRRCRSTNGPIISGEPNTGGWSSGSYNIPTRVGRDRRRALAAPVRTTSTAGG